MLPQKELLLIKEVWKSAIWNLVRGHPEDTTFISEYYKALTLKTLTLVLVISS